MMFVDRHSAWRYRLSLYTYGTAHGHRSGTRCNIQAVAYIRTLLRLEPIRGPDRRQSLMERYRPLADGNGSGEGYDNQSRINMDYIVIYPSPYCMIISPG